MFMALFDQRFDRRDGYKWIDRRNMLLRGQGHCMRAHAPSRRWAAAPIFSPAAVVRTPSMGAVQGGRGAGAAMPCPLLAAITM